MMSCDSQYREEIEAAEERLDSAISAAEAELSKIFSTELADVETLKQLVSELRVANYEHDQYIFNHCYGYSERISKRAARSTNLCCTISMMLEIEKGAEE